MNSDDFFNYSFGFIVAILGLALLVHIAVSAKCKLYGGCYYPQASVELKGGLNAGSSGTD